MYLSDQACLLRKAESGERNLLLVFFLRAHGLRQALAHRGTRPGGAPPLPDLFETGEVVLRQKDPAGPAFLHEYHPGQRLPGIARDYRALLCASRLARFYERNLLHLESFAPAWDLLQAALASMADKPLPEAALLKALFRFARAEGYPVVNGWLHKKPPAEGAAIAAVLHNPLADLDGTADPELLRHWLEDLYRFFELDTDLLPPEA